jgi:hypothetical protein
MKEKLTFQFESEYLDKSNRKVIPYWVKKRHQLAMRNLFDIGKDKLFDSFNKVLNEV